MIDLNDRHGLLTGAGGAIGSTTARTVARAGGRVILHDRDEAALATIATEVGERGTPLTADLRDPGSGDALWKQAEAIHGHIDVLINNAGIYPSAPIDDPLDDWLGVWDTSLAVNLVAPAVLCRAAVRAFREQAEGGIIINIASRAAFRGEDPDYWHYAAAKAGIVAMTRTIARHYGREGVTAFAIAPGYVDTPFNQEFADTVGVEIAATDTGLGEVAQPQDIANVLVFLASGLARHATGTTIDINGASYVR